MMSTLVSIVVGIVANILTLVTGPVTAPQGLAEQFDNCAKIECKIACSQHAMSTTEVQKMN
jgi:hypothetical protein